MGAAKGDVESQQVFIQEFPESHQLGFRKRVNPAHWQFCIWDQVYWAIIRAEMWQLVHLLFPKQLV